MIRISDGAHLRELAASVITQAVKDFLARGGPAKKQLEAFMWLTGPEVEIWGDYADYEIDVYKLLPRLGQARKKLKGK